MRSQNKLTGAGNTPLAIPAQQPANDSSPRHTSLVTGLKILEHLSMCRTPATSISVAAALKLPKATIGRLLLALERRGYVTRTGKDGSYTTTRRLEDIQTRQQPHQRLISHAEPIMRVLSERTAQSCNLAIPFPPDLQVIAQVDAPGPYGIHIPVGYRYDIPASGPGLVFTAFMQHSDPARWPQGISDDTDPQPWTALRKAVMRTTQTGYAQSTHPQFPDITDLSCPIFDNNHFQAALTIPYIKTIDSPNLAWCLAHLQQATEQLNKSLRSGVRVV